MPDILVSSARRPRRSRRRVVVVAAVLAAIVAAAAGGAGLIVLRGVAPSPHGRRSPVSTSAGCPAPTPPLRFFQRRAGISLARSDSSARAVRVGFRAWSSERGPSSARRSTKRLQPARARGSCGGSASAMNGGSRSRIVSARCVPPSWRIGSTVRSETSRRTPISRSRRTEEPSRSRCRRRERSSTVPHFGGDSSLCPRSSESHLSHVLRRSVSQRRAALGRRWCGSSTGRARCASATPRPCCPSPCSPVS